MKRNIFLKSLVGLGAASTIPFSSHAELLQSDIRTLQKDYKAKGNAIGLKAEPIEKVRVGIIGIGNRGKTLTEMLYWLIENEHAEIIAMSDLKQENCDITIEKLSKYQKKKPKTYCKDEKHWKKLAKRKDIDLLLICTPWHLHAEMCIYGMEKGKHVSCEVPIAYTLEDCWSLVKTAEETQKHCIMIENCCYNGEELFVLNMIQNRVFGDLTHAEGAYLHDLRALLLSDTYYQGKWRLKEHETRNGNFYTTHGLGPISTYMNIGRGDTFDHLTSMSSRELNLTETAVRENVPTEKIICGDMNTTMIKTAKGKTIMLQFDVHSGQPYSRINKVVGTKAVHQGYPSKLYLDDPNDLKFWGHEWLTKEDYKSMYSKHEHPMIKKLKGISEKFKQGHGGMDFVMMYRLIRCLNLGLPLDLNVYDAAMWSAITPLSEVSVANESASVKVPDFTGGTWQKERSLEIMRALKTD